MQIMSFSTARPTVMIAGSAQPRCQVAAGIRTTSALSGRSSYMGNRLRTPVTQLSPGDQRSTGCMSRQCKRQVTRASFLGVGAPEAILVGVVALVVFGPKGLAEAAKGVGKTLRAFAPTLQELTSVSRDLKNTLDNELGIDEIRRDFASAQSAAFTPPKPKQQEAPKSPVSPTATAVTAEASVDQSLQAVSDEIAQSMDSDIDRKREQAAQAAWGGQAPVASDMLSTVDISGSDSGGGGDKLEAAGVAVGNGAESVRKVALDELSLDDLQAELERRKQASSN